MHPVSYNISKTHLINLTHTSAKKKTFTNIPSSVLSKETYFNQPGKSFIVRFQLAAFSSNQVYASMTHIDFSCAFYYFPFKQIIGVDVLMQQLTICCKKKPSIMVGIYMAMNLYTQLLCMVEYKKVCDICIEIGEISKRKINMSLK